MIPGLAVPNEGYANGLNGHTHMPAIGFNSITVRDRATAIPKTSSLANLFPYDRECKRESMTGLLQPSSLQLFTNRHLAQRHSAPQPLTEHFTAAQLALRELSKLADRFRHKSRHELEKTWLAEHRHEYRGRWIALDGNRLLATAACAKEVFAQVASHKPTPLVTQIPEQELPFAGW
jgi:hypothetical protein